MEKELRKIVDKINEGKSNFLVKEIHHSSHTKRDDITIKYNVKHGFGVFAGHRKHSTEYIVSLNKKYYHIELYKRNSDAASELKLLSSGDDYDTKHYSSWLTGENLPIKIALVGICVIPVKTSGRDRDLKMHIINKKISNFYVHIYRRKSGESTTRICIPLIFEDVTILKFKLNEVKFKRTFYKKLKRLIKNKIEVGDKVKIIKDCKFLRKGEIVTVDKISGSSTKVKKGCNPSEYYWISKDIVKKIINVK